MLLLPFLLSFIFFLLHRYYYYYYCADTFDLRSSNELEHNENGHGPNHTDMENNVAAK